MVCLEFKSDDGVRIPLEGRGEVFGAPALAPKRLTGLSSTAVTVL